VWLVTARDGKKLRDKVRKIASKVEEEDCTGDLEMVSVNLDVVAVTTPRETLDRKGHPQRYPK